MKQWFSASAENGIHTERIRTGPNGNGDPHRGSARGTLSLPVLPAAGALVEGAESRLRRLRPDARTCKVKGAPATPGLRSEVQRPTEDREGSLLESG